MPANRMLQFKTGGWVILLAVLVSAALGARILIPALNSGRGPLVGDKKNIDTYGFDLSNLINANARYLQYRFDFASTDLDRSPQVRSLLVEKGPGW